MAKTTNPDLNSFLVDTTPRCSVCRMRADLLKQVNEKLRECDRDGKSPPWTKMRLWLNTMIVSPSTNTLTRHYKEGHHSGQ